MSGARNADAFIVVNGPEDGAEFTVTRSPFEMGSGSMCAIFLRLDNAIDDRHAHILAESNGYRIRALGPGPVFVDGKRASMVRSRMAKDGSYIQVGHTMLLVECSCDGLAKRSRGVGSAGDVVWAGKAGMHGGIVVVRRLRLVLRMLLRRLRANWFVLGVLGAVLYFTVPGFRYWAQGVFYWFRWSILQPIFNMFG